MRHGPLQNVIGLHEIDSLHVALPTGVFLGIGKDRRSWMTRQRQTVRQKKNTNYRQATMKRIDVRRWKWGGPSCLCLGSIL